MPDSSFHLTYTECRDLLRKRLGERPPGRIQLLTGPRQVGKTTLLLGLSTEWSGRCVYAAADGPEASLPGFWERLWTRVESVARGQGKAIVLIDEAHVIHDWAARLKGEWDRIRRERLPIHIVATGSSALSLGTGSRESLAGRFERIVLTHWPASSLVEVFKVGSSAAADLAVRMGTYPGAFSLCGASPEARSDPGAAPCGAAETRDAE